MDDFFTKGLSSMATERLRFLHEGALFGIGEVVDPGVPGAGGGLEVELLVGTLGFAARAGFAAGVGFPELPEPGLLDPPELGEVPEGAPEKMSFCAPKNTSVVFIEPTGRAQRKGKVRR